MHDDRPPAGCATRTMWRFENGRGEEAVDRLAEEVPVAIHLDGHPFAVMMASPMDVEDFARGFALTEGLVSSMDDIVAIAVDELLEGIVVDIDTGGTGTPRSADTRQLPGRSGCGICGTRELEDVVRQPPDVGTGTAITGDAIQRALDALRSRQPVNAFTGSVHAAAWVQADGAIQRVREDVGRHNALDKLIGAGIDPDDGFALITSRASYEMVTKAAMAGIAVLVAISAPTALAVQLANRCGVTLVGFARPGRFNVYTHPHRIL